MRVEVDEYDVKLENFKKNLTLEKMKERISGLVSDFDYLDSDEDALAEIKNRIRKHPFSIIEDLYSLEILLANSTQSEFLFKTVLWDANKPMENKEQAIQWLQDFAEKLREMLGDKAPPKSHKIKR